jgi:hypothetical protein
MKAVALLLACASMACSAFAQGTINFTNMKPTKKQVFDADGKPLKGAWAQLHAGKTADSMVPAGPPVAFFDDFKEGYFSGKVVELWFLSLGYFQVWFGRGLKHLNWLRRSANRTCCNYGRVIPPQVSRRCPAT